MTSSNQAPASGSLPSPAVGRLPDLVIAGVTKAGTTSLFRYLAQHPQVCPSDEKELRHFLPLRYGEPIGTLEEYAAHFRHWAGEPVAMEASPGYFFGGAAVADAMAAALPEAKVVVVLRDPTPRVWSFFNFMKSRATVDAEAPFGPWLDQAEALVAAGVDQDRENHAWSGLGTGIYHRWLPAWTAAFGDRLRIVWFDDLAADPQAVVESLCAWVGVDVAPAAGFSYEIENKTRSFRSGGLQKAALAANRWTKYFWERNQGLKKLVRKAYFVVNKADDGKVLPAQAKARLDAFYAPHNATLLAQLPDEARASAPAWLTRPVS